MTARPAIAPDVLGQMFDEVGTFIGEVRQQLRDEFETEVKKLRHEISELRTRLDARSNIAVIQRGSDAAA